MAIPQRLAARLTDAFLGGPWTREALLTRAASLFVQQQPRRWLDVLIDRTLMAFPPTAPLPIRRKLLNLVSQSRIARSERPAGSLKLFRNLPPWPGQMLPPVGPATTWPIPPIVSAGELADWFHLSVGELEWFANCTGWNDDAERERLTHYRYRWIDKPSGGRRLLESPKPRLQRMQRQVLDQILNSVPLHPAAHAFRSGRSVATYVAPHQHQHVVLHIDLREFFPSVEASRVNALFRTLGYPERVARLFTGICTNSTPSRVLSDGLQRANREATWLRFRSSHLPQGAPSSPALANLCAHRLDARLSGLARCVSANYTRYADDLVFSGDRELRRCLPRLRVLIAAIILDEGFDIRHRKTRVMVAGTRQEVAGIRLNEHANIPRKTYDELKAILHNCHRFGPASQNREEHPRFREHLQGRLAYWSSICPERIMPLQRMLDQIDWTENE